MLLLPNTRAAKRKIYSACTLISATFLLAFLLACFVSTCFVLACFVSTCFVLACFVSTSFVLACFVYFDVCRQVYDDLDADGTAGGYERRCLGLGTERSRQLAQGVRPTVAKEVSR